ncbi:MAG: hypothetical protein IKX40_09730 [Thermoguttaceae bacterium]|nr:hypothetical protein [Thermoguttaceae bacterium]
MRNTLLFIVVAAVLGAGACFAQDVQTDDSNSPAAEEEFSLDKLMAELNEPETEQEKTGTDYLDEAMALKLSATTLKDIERILELSQKAIDKGLSAEEEKMARGLMRLTLLQRAAVTAEILRDGRAESEKEVSIIAQIGMMDLQQVKDTFGPKETEKEFDGADVYWYVKALLLAYSGQDNKDVAKAVKTAKKLNSENNARMAQLLFIEATLLTVDQEKRLDLMTKAYEKDSESEPVKRGYILALARNDKLEEAAKLILPMVGEEEEIDPIYMLVLSDYYRKQDQPEKALEWLNKLPKPAADNIEILMTKFYCAVKMEDKRQMLDISMNILNKEPDNIEMRVLRAKLMMEDKKYDDALQEINLALFFEDDSSFLQMMKSLILCYKDKANFDDARKAIDKLLEDKEADVRALIVARDAASVMKDPDLMLKLSQAVLKQDEKNKYALSLLPSVYIVLKQYDKAVEAFEKNLELEPENSTSLNNYSWFLSTIAEDAYRDGKKALELALKAAEATEYKQSYILSTLAAAYAETGDFENAIKTVQKALDDEKDEKLTKELKDELESYQQNKPIRQKAEDWFK